MSALAQTNTGDLDLSGGGLRVEPSVSQCTAWKLNNLFGLALGEWFRDTRLGIPYIQYIFVKNPNLALIQNIFTQVVLSAPGVKTLDAMVMDYTANRRNVSVSIQATTNEGAVLTGGSGTPFILDQKGLTAS